MNHSQATGWSTISEVMRQETAMLTCKSLNSLSQDYLRKLFSKCSDSSILRSSDTDLSMPLPKTINGQKAFHIEMLNFGTVWKCKQSEAGSLRENLQRPAVDLESFYLISLFLFCKLGMLIIYAYLVLIYQSSCLGHFWWIGKRSSPFHQLLGNTAVQAQ